MARKWYLDTTREELWDRPTRSRILRHSFVRGSTPQIELRYLTDGVVVDPGWLGSAVTLSFKAAPTDAALLIPAVTATKSGTGTSTVYTFAPVFSSSGLDTHLGNSDSAVAYGELKSDSTYDYNIQFRCLIYQNVNRGGESTPGVISSTQPSILNGITSFTGTSSTDLPYVPTTGLTAGSNIPYFIRLNGQFVPVYLESGAADGTDPGQVDPMDYHASTNNKHWTRGL